MLVCGMESKEKIDLLLSITKIESENLINALHDHFCLGKSSATAAALNGLTRTNMRPAIIKLNKIASFGESYHEIKVRVK